MPGLTWKNPEKKGKGAKRPNRLYHDGAGGARILRIVIWIFASDGGIERPKNEPRCIASGLINYYPGAHS